MRDLARLAIAAFGRQGEGSGVIGVDVQRIRRPLGLRAEAQPDLPRTTRAATASPRDGAPPLRGAAAPRARARADRAHRAACRRRGRWSELDRALPTRPAPGPRRGAPRRRAAQAPADDAGHENTRPQAPRARRRAPHDARLARDRRRAGRPELPAAPPAAARDLRALRRLDVGHERERLLPLACCTRCTTRSARCARSSSSSGSARSPTSSSASATSRRSASAIARDAGVADISGYTDYGRVWREFLEHVEDDLHPRATVIVLGDARTNGRDPRADSSRGRRARRAHVLAQPRAAALLELRRLGDRRLRAATATAFECWTTRPARGLREGADGRPQPYAAARRPEPARSRGLDPLTRRAGGAGHRRPRATTRPRDAASHRRALASRERSRSGGDASAPTDHRGLAEAG